MGIGRPAASWNGTLPIWLLDVARIIPGDHWNFSGILQLILASPKSRALSCLSSAPQCKTSLFIKWAPIVVWMSFHCLLLQTLIFFPSMVDLSQGSSMSSGYLRTFCFMRRDSSFSTARRSEGIVCEDHWNLSGILQLLFKGFSKVSCSLVPFKCSTVQNKSLYQVSPLGSLDVFS